MADAITIKQLEKLERNIERELILLKNKQIVVKGELQHRLNMNHGKCDHEEVRKGGGFLWISGTELHYHELWFRCLKCGKIFLESYISTKEKKNLEKNVVKTLYNPTVGDPPEPYGKMVCDEIAEKEVLDWPSIYDNIIYKDKLNLNKVFD